MIKVAKLTTSSWSYYTKPETLNSVVSGIWLGNLAQHFSLTALENAQQIHALFSSSNPYTNEPLEASHRKTAVYDFVFAAPKQVSILALVEENHDLNNLALKAHTSAVNGAFKFIEATISVKRQSFNNHIRYVQTKGLLALAINHQLSRSLDPHIHTHLLIANLTTNNFKKYNALVSSLIFAIQEQVSRVYEFSLINALSSIPAIDFKNSEIARLYSKQVVNFYSKRRLQIQNELLTIKKATTNKVQEIAFLKTRPSKNVVDLEKLQSSWRSTYERIKHKSPHLRSLKLGTELGELFTKMDLIKETERLEKTNQRSLEQNINSLQLKNSVNLFLEPDTPTKQFQLGHEIDFT